ncbi:MAG TPA: NAD(P)H-binding protein [Thermoplasmata archaeon]|nr:NAD(P)H-binding protein [Thermoplasmata archaeon]
MSAAPAGRPRLLVVGGTGGFVGRAVRKEFGPDWTLRSLHRSPDPAEASAGIEWVAGDASRPTEWGPILSGVDAVLNLAWYRTGGDRRFRPLAEGLETLIRACERSGVRRFVQISVPDAPDALESGLPYLARKRQVDRTLASSALDFVILRPTMLYGPRDKLLTVMLRTIDRYGRFPMFGDGAYHVSPLAVEDLARVIRREIVRPSRTIVPVGGPERWRYRDLTDLLFSALGRRPRYVQLTPRGAVRLARLLETFGSSLLYAYEVEWLLSDRLGLAPYAGLEPPLADVRPFVRSEAARRLGRSSPSPG